MKIPVTVPLCGEEEKALLAEVIDSGWLTQGSFVERFEQAVASYLGVGHAVATTSCTTAMHIALLLHGIGSGDEVILPSYTWIATANVVRMVGATPVFADIDLRTYNVTPETIAERITHRTKALLPVHQMGMPLDVQAISQLGRDHGLVTVEDAACGLGSRYIEEPVGASGNLACFSFHPRKVITTGEGGMIVTDDASLAERARALTHHGASISDVRKHQAGSLSTLLSEEFAEVGYNYRLTNLQGAVGLAQMSRLEDILIRRREIASRYNEQFAGMPYVIPPFVPSGAAPNWQTYALRIAEDSPVGRDQLAQDLLDAGIACRPGLIACHRQPAYRGFEQHLPQTEQALRTVLTLPIYPQMTLEEQDYVVGMVRRSFSAVGAAKE
ncbi:MAG TPA: DegT/DnrJ/EryC1/StrS family aminotransferase [Actinomycetota bacterium]|nr:DegT/DnrJ/EryC1/StrS family aminotransferase [Actinomycetota bacterium]